MDVSQGGRDLTDKLHGFSFLERSLSFYLLRQRPPGQVFHHVIGRVVFFEDVQDANDIRMVHPGDHLRFPDELAPEFLDKRTLAARTDRHVAGGLITLATILHEEFLHRDFAAKQYLFCLIGNPEASLTQGSGNTVLASLQRGTWL